MISRLWLLTIVVFATAPLPEVRADELIIGMRPEPGVAARVVRDPAGRIWLRQPFGPDIEMVRPPGQPVFFNSPAPELREVDVDLDGHTDLAVYFPEARADDPLQIIRYLPMARRYETLQPAAWLELRCDWRDAWLDQDGRIDGALVLSCRRGHASITETVHFNRFGAPWLQSRLIAGGLSYLDRYPYIPLATRYTRWDEAGRQQYLEVRDEHGEPIFLTIPVRRASLYREPSFEALTAAYLVRGDEVLLIDQIADWLLIRYEGEGGALERWVWIPEAFDLGAQFADAEPSDTQGLIVSAGHQTLRGAVDAASDIFPIVLTNKGDRPLSLNPELHLIFRSEETGYSWAHSIGNRQAITLPAGESVVLESGPAILRHGDYVLQPSEFGGYVDLFPFELPHGSYHVRAALTSPNLDMPLFASDEIPLFLPEHESFGHPQLSEELE